MGAFDASGRLSFLGGPFMPAAATERVSLGPEAGFLAVDWTFGGRALGPCATEIEVVEVAVRSGAALETAAVFGCRDGPVVLDHGFAPGVHELTLTALDFDGLPIYAHVAERILDRGLDTYTAVFVPLGGRLLLDWRFRLADQGFEACDDPRGAVTGVRASVISLVEDDSGERVPDGSAPVTGFLDCDAPRPVLLREARFREGRLLEVALTAEGAEHRFSGRTRLEMPSGDAVVDVGPLEAVARPRFEIAVTTPACDLDLRSVVDVRVESAAGEVVASYRTSLRTDRFLGPELPYAPYRVRLGRVPPVEGCLDAVYARRLEGPDPNWGVLEL